MDLLPLYQQAFDEGWIREVVYRKKGQQQCDIYYRKGTKKLRSSRELVTFLEENEGTDLSQENFTWKRQPLGIGEPMEVIRNTSFQRPSAEPIKKTKNKITKSVLKETESAGKSVGTENNVTTVSQMSVGTVVKLRKRGNKTSKKKRLNSVKKIVSTEHETDHKSGLVIDQNKEEDGADEKLAMQCEPCSVLLENASISDTQKMLVPATAETRRNRKQKVEREIPVLEPQNVPPVLEESNSISVKRTQANQKRIPTLKSEKSPDKQETGRSKGHGAGADESDALTSNKISKRRKRKEKIHEEPFIEMPKVTKKLRSSNLPLTTCSVMPSKMETEVASSIVFAKMETEVTSSSETEATSSMETEATSSMETEATSSIVPTKMETEATSSIVPSKVETEFKPQNVRESMDLTLLKPMGFGWKREVVYRKGKVKPRTCDIYYYSPVLQKFRSARELERHDLGNNLSVKNFTFVKHPLGLPASVEIVRRAK